MEGRPQKVHYGEMMEEDLSDSDEYNLDEESSDSDVEEAEKHSENPKKIKKISPRFSNSHTDDERDDTPAIRALRRKKQGILRSEMDKILKGVAVRNQWIPDKRDQEDLKTYITRPTMKRSKKFTTLKSYIPEDVLEEIESTEGLKPKNRRFVSKTGRDYEYAFKKLLYIWQEYLRENDPDNLSSDQMLHIRQFFEFKSRTFLDPFNLLDLLESKVRSPNLKCKMYASYRYMLDQQYKAASDPAGKSLFCKAMTDEEKSWDADKLLAKGLKRRKDLLVDIRNVKSEMEYEKPMMKWKGEIEGNRKRKLDEEAYFEGKSLPDPSVIIPKWLNHETTKTMDRKIVQLAKDGTVVSGKMMNQITKHLIIKQDVKIGSRTEVWEKLTWGHYREGRQKGYSAFPHRQLHLHPDVDPRKVAKNMRKGKSGERIYVREDPWKEDVNDPGDHMSDKNIYQVLKGTCCTLRFHKTGHKQPAYVWFSLVDDFYIRCYEEIVANYLKSKGKKMDNDTPMFIDANCVNYVKEGKSVNLDEFCRICEIPSATMYLFRDLFVNTVYSFGSGKFFCQVAVV